MGYTVPPPPGGYWQTDRELVIRDGIVGTVRRRFVVDGHWYPLGVKVFEPLPPMVMDAAMRTADGLDRLGSDVSHVKDSPEGMRHPIEVTAFGDDGPRFIDADPLPDPDPDLTREERR